MKRLILLFSIFCVQFSVAQDTQVSEGDILQIGSAVNHGYQYIDMPRGNFIIKKGGIANYNSLQNVKVVVSEVWTSPEGSTLITLKRADGRKFFRTHREIKARLQGALDSGELITI